MFVLGQSGETMILRTAKRGDKNGNRFWGCSRFPDCRYTESP